MKTYEDKAAAEDLAARKQLLDAAEQDGRIDATTRPIYENLLANDRENGEKGPGPTAGEAPCDGRPASGTEW